MKVVDYEGVVAALRLLIDAVPNDGDETTSASLRRCGLLAIDNIERNSPTDIDRAIWQLGRHLYALAREPGRKRLSLSVHHEWIRSVRVLEDGARDDALAELADVVGREKAKK